MATIDLKENIDDLWRVWKAEATALLEVVKTKIQEVFDYGRARTGPGGDSREEYQLRTSAINGTTDLNIVEGYGEVWDYCHGLRDINGNEITPA